MFVTIQTFSKSSFSLSLIGQGSKQNFLSFSLKFLQEFLTSKAGKTFLPFLFHLFSCFMHFGKILNLRKIGVFVDFNLFFQNWSLGFCYGMLLNCSLVFNLINLLNWEKLNFLGLETTRIGDFVQLSIIWWNWLVRLTNLIIIICSLSCVLINCLVCWNLWKWVFKIWGFWI